MENSGAGLSCGSVGAPVTGCSTLWQRRRQVPPPATSPAIARGWTHLVNEPDTDFALPQNGEWAQQIMTHWEPLHGEQAVPIPLVIAVLLGHYVFKFHPAILFGVCAGVRTTTAALGMIQEAAKSKVPALGYGMPYAIGNTLLTIFGMVIVLMMSGG